MPPRLLIVADGLLNLSDNPCAARVAVDSADWFAWLEQPETASFAFHGTDGGFTARKERRQRGAHYWIAYRKVDGKLRNAYLGKSAALTLERLTRAAAELAGGPGTTANAATGAVPQASQPLPPDLLATKLYVPSARHHVIPRPRLLDQFEAGLVGKLTLISAPAGFGKTTLVSEWRATPAGSAYPLAWVSLDATDRDPARFWSYVSAALDQLLPGAGTRALALLRSSRPPTIETVLLSLLNALSAFPADAALVLDDYHLIDVAPIHQAVGFMLDHLPPRLHLVIITRADPPLPLARLRARGELVELRAADLRFTSEEVSAFLAEVMGVQLSPTDVATLDARTEGWIAGLQFAALAMRGRGDRDSFVTSFSGSHRFVMDYLVDEVLARQPAHLQRFMLHTAILDRMCGPLCDALLLGPATDDQPPRADRQTAIYDDAAPSLAANSGPASFVDSFSQVLLEEIERGNLFLIALDDERRWYRYHHLFADVLRQRLATSAGPEFVASLHGRAAAWYEREGLIVEAMEHALAARAWPDAARMIEHHAMRFIFQGQVGAVLGWLHRLPDPFVRADGRLCLIYALGLGDTGRLDAAEARLQDAERLARSERPPGKAEVILGEVALIRAMLARSLGDIGHCVALSREALVLLPPSEAARRSAAMLNLARGYLQSGDVTQASERLALDAVRLVGESGNLIGHLSALANLARLQALQGRLHIAAATYRRTAEIPVGAGSLQALGSGAASYYIGLSSLHYEWNELDAAEEHLSAGMELVQGTLTIDAHVVAAGYITQARIQQVRGDGAAARATLQALVNLAGERGFAPQIADMGVALQARLALASGDLQAAVRWADHCGLEQHDAAGFTRYTEYATLARVRIARALAASNAAAGHDLGMAVRLLDDLAERAELDGRMGHLVEILTLRALALHAQADGRGALRYLERALLLAAPEGYVRLFADEGLPIARLLRRAQVSRIAPAYVEMLLRAFGTASESVTPRRGSTPSPESHSTRTVIEPPTSRELDVLRLIAAGKSNAEIARALVIAISTVRTHTNNIYGKLGVTRRTEAVARARELDLL